MPLSNASLTVPGNPSVWWTVQPSSLTIGSELATTAGTVYYCQLYIPNNCTLTGMYGLTGTTVGGTAKAIYNLYNSSGQDVAHTNLAGTVVPTASNFFQIAFTAQYVARGPALYFASVSLDGTTTRYRNINPNSAAATFAGWWTGSTAGTFGTLPTIVPPTAPTTNIGPIMGTY